MLTNIIQIILGLVVISLAANWFITGSAAIARNLGVKPLLIGLTIVALGTSAPEIFIAIVAAWHKNTDLAVGNAIGSNIANIGLVLGIVALIAPLKVKSKVLRREFPILFIIMLATMLMFDNGYLSRLDGIIFLIALVALVIWLAHLGLQSKRQEPLVAEYREEIPRKMPWIKAIFLFLIGIILLPISSQVIVESAVNIATLLNISNFVIGLTVVAIGTSLPECATAIAAQLKNEDDLVIGNILGSNMFNLVAVIGIAAVIHPTQLPAMLIRRDMPVMLFITIIFYLSAFARRKVGQITRLEGSILLTVFILYLGLVAYFA